MNKLLDFHAKNIQWLEFELSNQCNYKNIHKWCPLYYDKRHPIFLSTSIIEKTVQFFKRYNFSGRIYLSGYSEPLIDPRLISLIKYIKQELPFSNIDMFTNGTFADEYLLQDVINTGVDTIRLSIYNEEENIRLRNIVSKVSGHILFHPRNLTSVPGGTGEDIDDRLKIYDNVGNGLIEPCYMPSLYYFVRNNGDVNMCFMDWKYTEIFGNLYNNSIEETLLNENRLNIIENLLNNKRKNISVCSGCNLPAERCIQEYKSRLKFD